MNKKSILASFMIMISATVFATGNPSAEGELKSALKVVPEGEWIQVYYAGIAASDVKLVIRDEKGLAVHRESIDKLYSFQRGYNMSQLNYGTYTFELTTEEGTIEQVVNYTPGTANTLTFFTESLDEQGIRQLVRVPAGQDAKAKISIYSNLSGLLYQEVATTEEGFAKIYRLDSKNEGETMSIVVDPIK